MKVKGLLFDLDGVIVDTAKYHYLAWKEIADELNIEFTLKDNERLKGVSRERSFDIVLEVGGLQVSEEKKKQYCTRKNDIYVQYIQKINESEILPGVHHFLKEAKAKGYKIALGSASKNSMMILDAIKLTYLFDQIIDGTKVTKAKPDPEVFIRGAEALGIYGEDCIVFEDATAGIEAAHRAGMKAVGVGSKEMLPEADMNILTFEKLTMDEVEDLLWRKCHRK